jgi:hypothetical protein
VLTATLLLAVVIALLVSVLIAVFLPAWASALIALGAVFAVAIGGGALLVKAAAACGVLLIAAWAWRRRAQRRAPSEDKLFAIPQAQAPRKAERRAA